MTLSVRLVEQIKSLSARGHTPYAISKRIGCHHDTVLSYLEPERRAKRMAEIIARRKERDPQRTKVARRRISLDLSLLSYDDLRQRLLTARYKTAKNALYDPLRDAEAVYAEPTGAWFGDPPIGRRELLEQWAEQHPDMRAPYKERRNGHAVERQE